MAIITIDTQSDTILLAPIETPEEARQLAQILVKVGSELFNQADRLADLKRRDQILREMNTPANLLDPNLELKAQDIAGEQGGGNA